MGNFNLKSIWKQTGGTGGSTNLEQRVQAIENGYFKKEGGTHQVVRNSADFYANVVLKRNGFVDNVDSSINTSMINKQYLEQQLTATKNQIRSENNTFTGTNTFTQPLTVASPTANTNATTKEYVDNKIRKRVIDIQNTQGNTYTIEPVQGYEILSVMVGRKRTSDGYYFFQYNANLNFQLFLHTDGTYRIYTQGPVSGFDGNYRIIVVEMTV